MAVELKLAQGADVNAENSPGSALKMAVMESQRDMAELLLAHGADGPTFVSDSLWNDFTTWWRSRWTQGKG